MAFAYCKEKIVDNIWHATYGVDHADGKPIKLLMIMDVGDQYHGWFNITKLFKTYNKNFEHWKLYYHDHIEHLKSRGIKFLKVYERKFKGKGANGVYAHPEFLMLAAFHVDPSFRKRTVEKLNKDLYPFVFV